MLYLEDLKEGQVFWGDECVADRAEMLEYAQKNDPLPFHVDEELAKESPFGGLIASGGYTISLAYRSAIPVFGQFAMLGVLDWHLKWPGPLRPGDVVRDKFTIVGARASSKPGRGIVDVSMALLNQDDESALETNAVWLFASRPEG